MSALRVILIAWSVLGAAGAMLLFVLALDWPGASAMRVFALLAWAALYGLNLLYILRSAPKRAGDKI